MITEESAIAVKQQNESSKSKIQSHYGHLFLADRQIARLLDN